MDDLQAFINKLRIYIIESPYAGNYTYEIIELSECIIKTYTALMEGNYINSELLFTYVDRLCDHVNLLYLCKERKLQDCINDASKEKQFVDAAVIETQFEEFNSLAKKILHKHMVFNFTFENVGNFEYL